MRMSLYTSSRMLCGQLKNTFPRPTFLLFSPFSFPPFFGVCLCRGRKWPGHKSYPLEPLAFFFSSSINVFPPPSFFSLGCNKEPLRHLDAFRCRWLEPAVSRISHSTGRTSVICISTLAVGYCNNKCAVMKRNSSVARGSMLTNRLRVFFFSPVCVTCEKVEGAELDADVALPSFFVSKIRCGSG